MSSKAGKNCTMQKIVSRRGQIRNKAEEEMYYAENSEQKGTNKEQGRKKLYYAGNSQQKGTNKEQGRKGNVLCRK